MSIVLSEVFLTTSISQKILTFCLQKGCVICGKIPNSAAVQMALCDHYFTKTFNSNCEKLGGSIEKRLSNSNSASKTEFILSSAKKCIEIKVP